MKKGYIIESKTTRSKEGYPYLCWMDIPADKLTKSAEEDAEFRFVYHHTNHDVYIYSYVYKVAASILETELKPYMSAIQKENKGGVFYRVFLNYTTGEMFSALSQRTRKLMLKVCSEYKAKPVRLGYYAVKDAEKRTKKKARFLMQLVAQSTIWAPNAAIEAQSPESLIYVRRKSNDSSKIGSKDEKGNILDNNTKPNKLIKDALKEHLGYSVAQNEYAVCHIWEKSCYDAQYHANLKNIVLIPRSLASLSDYDKDIADMLKYRAYERNGEWCPEGYPKPEKPIGYDSLSWLDLPSLKDNIN